MGKASSSVRSWTQMRSVASLKPLFSSPLEPLRLEIARKRATTLELSAERQRTTTNNHVGLSFCTSQPAGSENPRFGASWPTSVPVTLSFNAPHSSTGQSMHDASSIPPPPCIEGKTALKLDQHIVLHNLRAEETEVYPRHLTAPTA